MAPSKGRREVRRTNTEKQKRKQSSKTRKEPTTQRTDNKENQQGGGGQANSPRNRSCWKRNADAAILEEDHARQFVEHHTERSPDSETNYTNESQEIWAPYGSLAGSNDSSGTSKKARRESTDTSVVSGLTGPGGSTPGSLPARNKTVVVAEMPNPFERTNTFNMYTQQELTQTQEALENIKKNNAAIDAGGQKALNDAARFLKECSKNVSTTKRRDSNSVGRVHVKVVCFDKINDDAARLFFVLIYNRIHNWSQS